MIYHTGQVASERDDNRPLVVHIAPTPFFANRGCHIRILNEIRALQHEGVRVILCTYGLGHDVPGVDIRRIPRIPGYTKTTAGFSPFKPLADCFLLFLVLSVVLRERATIIHGHLHEGGLLGWFVKMVLFWRRIDLIMDVQGSLSGELAAYGTFRQVPLLIRLFYYIERVVLWLPDTIICSSRASLSFLADQCRVAPSRLHLVGDVVPASFFEQRDKNVERTRLHLPADRAIVIYTGSLLPGKGIDLLLEAVRQVLAQRADTHVVLLGYPKAAVEAQIADWPYRERIVLPGEVAYEALADWLAAADLAVDPKGASAGEASGKILHYLAGGLPVVCFDTDNNRRFLAENGFFAAAETAADLAQAIDLALTDEQTRTMYGKLGRRRAAEAFSSAALGQQLVALYCRAAK